MFCFTSDQRLRVLPSGLKIGITMWEEAIEKLATSRPVATFQSFAWLSHPNPPLAKVLAATVTVVNGGNVIIHASHTFP